MARRSDQEAGGRSASGGVRASEGASPRRAADIGEATPVRVEVKGLHETVLGRPAPEIVPPAFVPFPVGVDPREHALLEVQRIDSSQPLPRWQPDAAARAANRQYVEFLATQHDDPAWK